LLVVGDTDMAVLKQSGLTGTKPTKQPYNASAESETQLRSSAKPNTKVWVIDPVKQTVSEIDNPNIPSLVAETVGDNADCFKLDGKQNVVWMSDTDTNARYAYFWEGMDYSFSVKRYSKALVVSLPSNSSSLIG
jgi:hypothetical protein